MTQHVLIGDVGPALLVLGVTGPLALFVVPRPALRALARPRPRAVLRVLGRPWVAFVAWIVVMARLARPGGLRATRSTHRWAHDLRAR